MQIQRQIFFPTAQTNKTTILKHMSFKKTKIGNVLRTCKDHNLEEYEMVKDAIAET